VKTFGSRLIAQWSQPSSAVVASRSFWRHLYKSFNFSIITRDLGDFWRGNHLLSRSFVCMYALMLNFRNAWPRQFVFGMREYLSHILYINVIGSRSRSQEQKSVCVSCSGMDCLRLRRSLVYSHPGSSCKLHTHTHTHTQLGLLVT